MKVARQGRFILTALGLLLYVFVSCVFAGHCQAQLPTAYLRNVWPHGATAGSSIDLVAEGDFLDEAKELVFSDPRITANVKMGEPVVGDPNPVPRYGHFTVSIPADFEQREVDVRVLGRYGLSNPRTFLVNKLATKVVDAARFSSDQAIGISKDEIVLARVADKQVDHYRIALVAGERIEMTCDALTSDSMLVANIAIYDAAGAELTRVRATKSTDAKVSFTPSESGDYIVKVSDVLFRGGAPYFYRLCFEAIASDPTGIEPTASELASQKAGEIEQPILVEIPAVVRSSFRGGGPQGTRWIDFDALAGEPWMIEIVSADRGAATDPDMQIGRVRMQGDGTSTFQRLHHVDDFGVLPGSLMGETRKDPWHRFVAPEDGRYRVVVRDLQTAGDPWWDKSFILSVRRAAPDFQLLAMVPHPTLDPARSTPMGTLLRKGERLAIEVAVVPEDGFLENLRAEVSLAGGELKLTKNVPWEWPIEVSAEGLPPGVTCQPVKLDTVNRRSYLMLDAHDLATNWMGPVRIVGRIALPAELGGKSMARQAQTMAIQLADPDGRGHGLVRVCDEIRIAVTDKESAGYRVFLGEASPSYIAKLGQNLEIPVRLERSADAKGKVTLRGAGLPAGVTAAEINLEGETLTDNLTLTVAANAPKGTFQIFLNAESELPWPRNPEALQRAELRLAAVKQQLEQAGEADKEAVSKVVAEVETQVNGLRESTKPQNARLFLPSNTVEVTIQAAE